jgi:hypothetical protein
MYLIFNSVTAGTPVLFLRFTLFLRVAANLLKLPYKNCYTSTNVLIIPLIALFSGRKPAFMVKLPNHKAPDDIDVLVPVPRSIYYAVANYPKKQKSPGWCETSRG